MNTTQSALIQELLGRDEASLRAELLQHWGKQDLSLIGRYSKHPERGFGFFDDLMDEEGNPLTLPSGLTLQPRAFVPPAGNLRDGDYYRFQADLNKPEERVKRQNPFYLVARPASIQSYGDARAFVQHLHDLVDGNERLARMVANFFDKISGDLYEYKERFVFELIQNADDYPNREGRVKLRFIFEDDYLVVLHDGAPFNRRNVDAVCDVGESDADKRTDMGKIGYKGIGFKSLFIDASCVYIRSGLFQFRFERPEGPREVVRVIPWQVKPLWDAPAGLPEAVRSRLTWPVAMVLRLERETLRTYKEKLRGIFAEPRFLLFLRHVHSITVVGLEREELELRKTGSRDNAADVELRRGGALQSTWRLSAFPVDISTEVAAEIERDKRVPDKMRLARQSNLVFAAPVDQGRPTALPAAGSVLFNYLPTGVKQYGFPFLVNADFLTSASRESLHSDCAWNHFLFEAIGYKGIEWLAAIAGTSKRHFLQLLRPKFEPAGGEMEKAYNRGLDRACQEIAFVPSAEGPELLKVGDAIVDETGLAAQLGYNKLRQHLNRPAVRFVAPDVEKPLVLRKLGASVFGYKDLPGFLASAYFADASPELYVAVLDRLRRAGGDAPDLTRVEFLPDAAGTRRAPAILYFDPGPDQKAHTGFDQFHFLASELTARMRANADLRMWVEAKLGVRTFNPDQIIRERIRLGRLAVAPKAANLDFVRFLFKHRAGQWDKASLGNLQVLYIAGAGEEFGKLAACYLPQAYDPPFALEDVPGLEATPLVSPDYMTDPADKAAWRQFFLSLHVAAHDGASVIEKTVLPLVARGGLDEARWRGLTAFLFRVWRENDQTLPKQLQGKLGEWRLKTVGHGLQPASKCVLRAPYADHDEPLTSVVLTNVVAADYTHAAEGTVDDWRHFLVVMGVPMPDRTELLNEKVRVLVAEPQRFTAATSAPLLKEILGRWDEVNEDNQGALGRTAVVVTAKGEMAVPTTCYFPQAYEPAQNLEKLFEATDFSLFVSPAYLGPLGDPEAAKAELAKLGVRDTLRVTVTTERKTWKRAGLEVYAQALGVGAATTIEMQGFVHVPHLTEYEGNHAFCKALWAHLAKDWDQLNLTVGSELLSPVRRAVKTHFQHSLATLDLIPCTDGICRKASQVFSKRRKDLVRDLPDHHLADFSLKPEIEEFIGLKTRLDASDLVVALHASQDVTLTESHEKRILRLYQFLNTELAKSDGQGTAPPPSLKLLGMDGIFRPAGELRALSPDLDMSAPAGVRLMSLPGTQTAEDLRALLAFLGVATLGWDDFEVTPEGSRPGDGLRGRIEARLPYIAAYMGGASAAQRIRSRLDKATFYQADKLVARCRAIEFETTIGNYYDRAPSDQNTATIYYVGSWQGWKLGVLAALLIEALGLDRNRVSPQLLCRLLTDSQGQIEDELREQGLFVEGVVAGTDEGEEPEGRTATEAVRVTTDGESPRARQLHDGKGHDPEYWGAVGEKWGRRLYQALQYGQIDRGGPGFDFHCRGLATPAPPALPAEVRVEVKAITGPAIRLTLTEWEFLLAQRNQESAELLIVHHRSQRDVPNDSVVSLVRVSAPRTTLKELILDTTGKPFTRAVSDEYPKRIEPLISIQREAGSPCAIILLNWERLLQGVQHPNIRVYRPSANGDVVSASDLATAQ